MTRMELLLQGDFLGLIKAEVFVSATYSISFSGAQFYVRVTVDLSALNAVSSLLRSGIGCSSVLTKFIVAS